MCAVTINGGTWHWSSAWWMGPLTRRPGAPVMDCSKPLIFRAFLLYIVYIQPNDWVQDVLMKICRYKEIFSIFWFTQAKDSNIWRLPSNLNTGLASTPARLFSCFTDCLPTLASLASQQLKIHEPVLSGSFKRCFFFLSFVTSLTSVSDECGMWKNLKIKNYHAFCGASVVESTGVSSFFWCVTPTNSHTFLPKKSCTVALVWHLFMDRKLLGVHDPFPNWILIFLYWGTR